ncbi:hypothetical protein ABIE67_005013 [Streptomyces sp. V4I8]
MARGVPGSLVGVRRAVCPLPTPRRFAALAANPPRTPFLGLLSWPERQAVARALRTETVGGLVLLVAAIAALVWANTPFSSTYFTIRPAARTGWRDAIAGAHGGGSSGGRTTSVASVRVSGRASSRGPADASGRQDRTIDADGAACGGIVGEGGVHRLADRVLVVAPEAVGEPAPSPPSCPAWPSSATPAAAPDTHAPSAAPVACRPMVLARGMSRCGARISMPGTGVELPIRLSSRSTAVSAIIFLSGETVVTGGFE